VLASLKSTPLDAEAWAASSYKPTPTIVEAAQALYRGHDVQEISRSEAGAENLSRTGAYIAKVIEEAKRCGRKAICFVTGVPGSGKTLAGLNIATERMRSSEDEHAVFLSGNGPLVAVLREALANDEVDRSKANGAKSLSKKDAYRHASSMARKKSAGCIWPKPCPIARSQRISAARRNAPRRNRVVSPPSADQAGLPPASRHQRHECRCAQKINSRALSK
jgi:hypothetical protein